MNNNKGDINYMEEDNWTVECFLSHKIKRFRFVHKKKKHCSLDMR
jgi:hypothetical protein